MDPKLKSYLEKMEARINKRFKSLATKSDLKNLEKKVDDLDKKIDDKTSDILEVIRNVNSNISDQVGKIDIAHSHLRQHVDHIFNRINYLEKKIFK